MCAAGGCWGMERWDRVLKSTRKSHWSESHSTCLPSTVSSSWPPLHPTPRHTQTHSPSRPLGEFSQRCPFLSCAVNYCPLTSKESQGRRPYTIASVWIGLAVGVEAMPCGWWTNGIVLRWELNSRLHGGCIPEEHCVNWKLRTRGTKEEGWWPPRRKEFSSPFERQTAQGQELTASRDAWCQPPFPVSSQPLTDQGKETRWAWQPTQEDSKRQPLLWIELPIGWSCSAAEDPAAYPPPTPFKRRSDLPLALNTLPACSGSLSPVTFNWHFSPDGSHF